MPHTTKIFGPPGTGKTYWLLNKLQEEIAAGVPVRRIGYVTFSRAAKEEAMNRARARLDTLADEDFRYFKTIHGICFAEVAMSRAHVMRTQDFMEFGKACPVEFSNNYSEDYDMDGYPVGWANSPGNLIMNIRQVASAQKVSVFDPELIQSHWGDDTRHSEVKLVLERYAKFKEREARFDFVDMLEMYERTGEPLPIDVLFVDEAQDLSKLQWALIAKMSAKASRLYIAGDDDQSIYGFLGADPYGFLDHPFDQKVLLRKSYRLQKRVWDYARRIIGHVKRREPKSVDVGPGGAVQFWGSRFDPERVISGMPSQELTGSDSIMIIGSTNYALSQIRSDMEKAGVPVMFKGQSLADSPEAKQFYWYHKARKGAEVPIVAAVNLAKTLKLPAAKDLAELSRLTPERKITPGEMNEMGVKFISNISSIEYLSQSNRARAVNTGLYATASRFGLEAVVEPPKISLQTFHSCKGREADHTIILTDSSPRAMAYAERNPDYDQRLAFVGATRAKRQANIIEHSTPYYMKGFRYV